ncbi:MAG TPA: ankyrin repeat domain-containing protein [Pyrinomonadaceae bacterium]|nr:ankyrin repeat domain-containing protein [Pyrinomonadaceae bacterium]
MLKNRRIIILVFGALFAIFEFSQILNAQELSPSYGFLEVVDYRNQPVAEASVRFLKNNNYREPQNFQEGLIDKTDQKGLLEKGIRIHYSNFEIPFSIDKTGFYPFIDYYGLFGFLARYERTNKDNPIRVELLKIPENRAEKKAIGNEQLKREFFGAARRGDALAVRKFIKSGLSPNLTTSDLRGVPATKDIPIIIFAARSGSGETVKEFLSAGVNVRTKDEPLRSILAVYLQAYPYRSNYYSATEAEKSEMLDVYENGAESLIQAGADVNSGVLQIAIDKGYTRTVKNLIAKGASLNTPDSIGRSALLTAIQSGQTEIVNYLLEKGASPNILSADNDFDNSYFSYCTSPLMFAIDREDVKLIKFLLANKADPNLTCKNGKNALRVALKKEKYDIYDLLLKAGADTYTVDLNGESNLMIAVRQNSEAAVKKMIELGIPVNARNKEGLTALMVAVQTPNTPGLNIVDLLLKAGAEPNIAREYNYTSGNEEIRRCETALIIITAYSDSQPTYGDIPLKIFDLLVAHKADVNYDCKNGENALRSAVRSIQIEGLKKLLQSGADIKGEKGKALLDYAVKLSQSEYYKSEANREKMKELIKLLEAAIAKK